MACLFADVEICIRVRSNLIGTREPSCRSFFHRPVDSKTSAVANCDRQQSSARAESHGEQDHSGDAVNRLLEAEKRRADLEAAMIGGIGELDNPLDTVGAFDARQDEEPTTYPDFSGANEGVQHRLPTLIQAERSGTEGISDSCLPCQDLVVLGTTSAVHCAPGSAGDGATLVKAPIVSNTVLVADEAVRVAAFERRARWAAAPADGQTHEFEETSSQSRNSSQAECDLVLEAGLLEIASYRELVVEDEIQRRKLVQIAQADRLRRAQVWCCLLGIIRACVRREEKIQVQMGTCRRRRRGGGRT